MTTTTAGPATLARARTDGSARTSRRQQRRADRAARRYQEQKRRHDLAVHDDRYLDHSGPAFSSITVAMVWQR